MCDALLRFGAPPCMVQLIRSIYAARHFTILDHAGTSSERTQHAGIAQGCPLTPYLFIIVQDVMLHHVFRTVDLQAEPTFIVTRDILYADD
eukprot:7791640-Pyramimonas_sp.AAC.1